MPSSNETLQKLLDLSNMITTQYGHQFDSDLFHSNTRILPFNTLYITEPDQQISRKTMTSKCLDVHFPRY